MKSSSRRSFIARSLALAATGLAAELRAQSPSAGIRLCLGQWSFHRAFRGAPGVTRIDSVTFPTLAGELGFPGVDYSGQLIANRLGDPAYIPELNRRAADAGVKNLLILVDGMGHLGAADPVKRDEAVAEHRRWLETTAALGGTGIRVNAVSVPALPADEQAKRVADGVSRLVALAETMKLDVLIENHGQGNSSNGAWIAEVVNLVNHPCCGTLADFGNFQKDRATNEWHDRYAGVAAMLPKVKAVCAKAHDFDPTGEECYTDYGRMMKLVLDSGFKGWIELEYEGPGEKNLESIRQRPVAGVLGEREGVLATKTLVEKYLRG